jgi:hypothetical protein
MATSPSFNWPEPDNTDLVKNGALAIRTAVDAIDTSMTDLLGGTTGQVLAKASGTDMDFTWSTPSTSAGYADNGVLNSAFNVWQRGTSVTGAGGGAYTADRWQEDATLAYPTSQTISRQTFTPGAAPVAGYEGRFFLRFAYTLAAGNGGQFITQKIENVQTFAGQTVTISFWAKAGAAINMDNATLRQNFGSGGSTTVQTTVGAASLTTSWQRFSFTVAVPSISGKTVGTNSFLELRIFMPATSSTTDIWGVQMEAGSTATAFQTATGTIQGELAACQRYYFRQNASGVYSMFANGFGKNTTNSDFYIQFPVRMRTAPTAVGVGGTLAIFDGGSFFNVTLTINSGTESVNGTGLAGAGTGFTANRPYILIANNNGATYLDFSAEL